MRVHIAALALTALAGRVLSPTGIAAQETGPDAAKLAPGVEDQAEVTLEPVVVTGTKVPTSAATLGSSLTVIEADELRVRQNVETVDALRTVPGLYVTEQGTQGTIATVEPRGAGLTFNQVLVDGVKLNDAGGVMNFAGLSLVNFDRIEVLRGPQSGLYGPDAAGSVIQYLTIRGHGPFHAEVSSGAGNLGTFEEIATMAGSTGPLGLSLGVHREDTDGDLRHSEFRSTTLSTRGDFARTDDLELTLALRYVNSHADLPVLVGGDRFVPLNPHQFVDQERFLSSLGGTQRIAPGWTHTLQLGYARHGADIVSRFDPGVNLFGSHATALEQRYSADYFWAITPPRVGEVSTVLTVGTAYEKEIGDQRVVVGPRLDSTREISVARELYSGYLQEQLNWRRRVFLTTGFRVDSSSVFGLAITPRVAAAAFLPLTETRLRSAYGKGIRAPSFIQLFGDGVGFVNGNRALRPERAQSWEVGVDQPVARLRSEVSMTYFQTRFDDLIVTVPGATPGSFNVARAEASGVEASLKANPIAWLTVTLAYTYLKSKILDNGGIDVAESPKGAPLLRQPRHWGSATADLRWRGTKASLTGIFVGTREDFNVVASPSRRVHLPPYSRFDAAVSHELMRDRASLRTLEIFGRVRNFTDARYEEVYGFSAPGVHYLFGLRARF